MDQQGCGKIGTDPPPRTPKDLLRRARRLKPLESIALYRREVRGVRMPWRPLNHLIRNKAAPPLRVALCDLKIFSLEKPDDEHTRQLVGARPEVSHLVRIDLVRRFETWKRSGLVLVSTAVPAESRDRNDKDREHQEELRTGELR